MASGKEELYQLINVNLTLAALWALQQPRIDPTATFKLWFNTGIPTMSCPRAIDRLEAPTQHLACPPWNETCELGWQLLADALLPGSAKWTPWRWCGASRKSEARVLEGRPGWHADRVANDLPCVLFQTLNHEQNHAPNGPSPLGIAGPH